MDHVNFIKLVTAMGFEFCFVLLSAGESFRISRQLQTDGRWVLMFLANPFFAWPVPAKFEFKNMEAVTVHAAQQFFGLFVWNSAPNFAELTIFLITWLKSSEAMSKLLKLSSRYLNGFLKLCTWMVFLAALQWVPNSWQQFESCAKFVYFWIISWVKLLF